MAEARFDGVARDVEQRLVATDCAEDLRERNVKIAQPRMRGLLLLILLLRLVPQSPLRSTGIPSAARGNLSTLSALKPCCGNAPLCLPWVRIDLL